MTRYLMAAFIVVSLAFVNSTDVSAKIGSNGAKNGQLCQTIKFGAGVPRDGKNCAARISHLNSCLKKNGSWDAVKYSNDVVDDRCMVSVKCCLNK